MSAPSDKTYCIQTLGCRVNQYEAQQVATLLRLRGWTEAPPEQAAMRIVNSCSVTNEAAAQSRQAARRMGRAGADTGGGVVIMGCWATSHPAEAAALPGVRAVIGHHDDVGDRLGSLLDEWEPEHPPACSRGEAAGTVSLPLLDGRQATHQRAYLKIQDGCDAHCTYCIIPSLRPRLWSKPIDAAVAEATRLVAAGHREIVLTGIFLGAYGQTTALHRRQSAGRKPLADLIRALCQNVKGLRRLRLSSLEPADLTDDLLDELRRHPQLMPHFHLPLQSGSDTILRRMNRQYGRADFLKMVQRVRQAFDRPAITTDTIVGFPGEDDAAFAETLSLVDEVRFLHIHAFPYSSRPGTAAARWKERMIDPRVISNRRAVLSARSRAHGIEFQRQFIGQEVEILVERGGDPLRPHGRCERYFDVSFAAGESLACPGDAVRLRIERVTDEGASAKRSMGAPPMFNSGAAEPPPASL